MNYLTEQQIRIINHIVIRETGGLLGVRDHHALSALEYLPQQAVFGKELYEGIYLKAAVYARNIITGHPFLDGNKRTGMACALTFLENNSYFFKGKKNEIEKFAVKIVLEKLELKEIAQWLKKRCRKVQEK